jgi:membrane dipeptidase
MREVDRPASVTPEELAFHQGLVVVDGHSDLVVDIYRRHRRGETAVFRTVHAEPLRAAGVDVLMLSTGGDAPAQNVGSDDPLWCTLQRIQSVHKEAAESGDLVALCTTAGDVERTVSAGKLALLMMIEGGRPLRDDVGMVELYHRLGIRSIQLTWNSRNLLGDGCAESETGGKLTRLGKAVVKAMNRLGMVIDLSHASEATFYSALETSQAPIIVSHANARAVCGHIRNLTDDQIRALARQGGVIGACLFPRFIDPEWPSMERLLDHVDHIASLVGAEHISLGPDLIDYALDIFLPELRGYAQGTLYGNDFQFPDDLKDVTALPLMTAGLRRRGWTAGDIAKVMGGNLLRVYRQIIG